MGRAAGYGAALVANPAMALAGAGPARASGGNLSTREPVLPGLLSVRGAARPPDARHAAHPAARTCALAAARLRRQRIRPGHIGSRRYGLGARARRALAGGPVRSRHA